MALSGSAILDAVDCPLTKVECPEWGGDVYIRTPGADTRAWYEVRVLESKAKGGSGLFPNFRAEFLVRVLCDESGKRLFSDDQAKQLGEKNADVVGRLFDKAFEKAKLKEEDVVDAGKS